MASGGSSVTCAQFRRPTPTERDTGTARGAARVSRAHDSGVSHPPNATLERLVGARGARPTWMRGGSVAEDLADLLHAGGDVPLDAAAGGLVVAAAAQFVGQILLRRDADVEVVGVDVSLAVAEALGPRVVRVAQMHRHPAEAAGAHVGDRGVDRVVRGVGLGGRGEVRGGLGERDPSLRHADERDGVGGGDGDRQCLRVGEPDVLGGRDHQTARDEARVLPRLDHASEVVHRGIQVGTADRLDERADHVVVLVALTVVAQQRPVDGLRDVVGGDLRRLVALIVDVDHGRRRLERGERAAGIARGQPDERGARLVAEGHRAVEPACVAHGAVDEHAEVLIGERLQRQQQRTGQQRRDHRERRILGGGGDEHDPAVLDARQQCVLLRLGEPVDLVEEEDGRLPVQVALGQRLLHDLAHVLDARRHRGELDEAAARRAGDGLRERGLARAGRPPQDDRGSRRRRGSRWRRGRRAANRDAAGAAAPPPRRARPVACAPAGASAPGRAPRGTSPLQANRGRRPSRRAPFCGAVSRPRRLVPPGHPGSREVPWHLGRKAATTASRESGHGRTRPAWTTSAVGATAPARQPHRRHRRHCATAGDHRRSDPLLHGGPGVPEPTPTPAQTDTPTEPDYEPPPQPTTTP